MGPGSRLGGRLPPILHLGIDIVNGSFGPHEALKIGLNENFQRCGFLINRSREGVESLKKRLGRCRRVDLGKEKGGGEGSGREEKSIAYFY